MLKQWSRARERCCMLISPPSACLPRSLLPPAPSSARRPPACGAPSFPAGPPPPASRSLAFPRVLPAAGEPHPGWPAGRRAIERAQPAWGARDPRLQRAPARPACGEANALGGGVTEPRQRPRDKPRSGRKSQKNKARSGRAGSFPHRLPALVRAAEPHWFELSAWSSPPPLTNTPTCPQRLRAVTLASLHPRPRAQLRASALINQKGPYN